MPTDYGHASHRLTPLSALRAVAELIPAGNPVGRASAWSNCRIWCAGRQCIAIEGLPKCGRRFELSREWTWAILDVSKMARRIVLAFQRSSNELFPILAQPGRAANMIPASPFGFYRAERRNAYRAIGFDSSKPGIASVGTVRHRPELLTQENPDASIAFT